MNFYKEQNYVLSPKTLFEKALDTIISIFKCRRCSIFLLDSSKTSLELQAKYGIDEIDTGYKIGLDEDRIVNLIFKRGKALLVKNIYDSNKLKDYASDRYYSPSFLSVPIFSDNKCIGIVNVSEKKEAKYFTSKDLKILTSVTSHIGKAYENMILQKEKIESEKLKRDVEIAAKIQSRILPKKFPINDKLEIYALSKPAQEVGGDFYDIFNLTKDKYGLVIGDVSGKGIPAAIFMALARNSLRSESKHHSKPGELFANSNIQLYEDSEQGMFATCAYFLVDTENREIKWSNAGHNHQMIYKKKKSTIEKLYSRGLPLGVDDEASFPNKITKYDEGDVLIMYTDGVTEAFDKDDEGIW